MWSPFSRSSTSSRPRLTTAWVRASSCAQCYAVRVRAAARGGRAGLFLNLCSANRLKLLGNCLQGNIFGQLKYLKGHKRGKPPCALPSHQGQSINHQTAVAKEVFPEQERLNQARFFPLQKHFFACKNQFDMNTLTSAYTQASSNSRTPTSAATLSSVLIGRPLCQQMQEKGLFKAMGELDLLFNYIEMYMSSKTHRNKAWRAEKPVGFYWNECWQPSYELLYFETSAELHCSQDKFSDHIVSLSYIPDAT